MASSSPCALFAVSASSASNTEASSLFQFPHYLRPLLLHIVTPPQDLLVQIMIQPDQQLSLQRLSIEARHHRRPPYLSPSLKVTPPQQPFFASSFGIVPSEEENDKNWEVVI